MPRFILDVANTNKDLDTKAFMEELCEKFGNHFLSVVCVDKTNDSQFHDDAKKNKLSKEQIQNYNDYLRSC
jgi:nicotinic acid phosphoribosyltransferase